MKLKFLTIKRKTVLAVILTMLIIVGGFTTFFTVRANASPKPLHTIVIDAGHGGIDGGAVGKTSGIDESHLNLQYAMALKSLCEKFGLGVVMTRSDMNGLYDISAPNKKKSEMAKRKQIIESSNADIVVSLHMNSFPLSSARGAQVYYAIGNDSGKALAESVGASLNQSIDYAKKTAKVGDYYVLNCTNKAGILVECGFLSNAEEEKLLISEDYKIKFCYNLLCGILKFYEM